MWHRVMCFTNCTMLYPLHSEGILASRAYCCLTRPLQLEYLQQRLEDEQKSNQRMKHGHCDVYRIYFRCSRPPLRRPLGQCHETITCTQFVCQCCEKNAVWIVVSRDSAVLEGGTASYGNFLAFPCGSRLKVLLRRDIRCGNPFRSYNFSLLVITSLSVTLHLDPAWKSWMTQ